MNLVLTIHAWHRFSKMLSSSSKQCSAAQWALAAPACMDMHSTVCFWISLNELIQLRYWLGWSSRQWEDVRALSKAAPMARSKESGWAREAWAKTKTKRDATCMQRRTHYTTLVVYLPRLGMAPYLSNAIQLVSTNDSNDQVVSLD